MSGALTHSPADIVRNLLIELSQGTAPADSDSWPIYVGQEPDSPDSVITITDSTNILQGRFMFGEVQEKHGFQVRVRDPEHYGGYEKSQAIAIALDSMASNTVVAVGDDAGTGSQLYTVYAVSRKGGVIALGKDVPRTKMYLFTINAVVTVRQVA